MASLEGLRLKILKYLRTNKKLVKKRTALLINKEYTIISNNCWGGMIDESYELTKRSPTTGLFFVADDYIKFLTNLKGYLSGKLEFIEPGNSKWKDLPEISNDVRFGDYPIGILSNGNDVIEIFFLHYHNDLEARDKWERRCKRINWNKLIIKFNDQNCCEEKHVAAFAMLPFKNKLFFTCKRWMNENEYKSKIGKGYCLINQWLNYESITASHEPFGKSKYINITEFINQIEN